MKIFEDILTKEEIIADSFTEKGEKCFNDCGMKVKSKMIEVGEEQFDVGCGDAFGGEKEDDGPSAVEKVVDLVHTYRYQETPIGKKDYMTYIKGYMKKIAAKLTETNPDRVEGFKTGAQEMVKWIIKNFDEFTFYLPESYETEGIYIMSYYDGEDIAPTFVFFMDGLKGVLV